VNLLTTKDTKSTKIFKEKIKKFQKNY